MFNHLIGTCLLKLCDASDYAIGAILGQRVDKKLNVIHYASKTLDSAQTNYATTEKEYLATIQLA